MLQVGLTGGIASGKSTVAEIWRAAGAVLIDSDLLAREAVAPGSPGLAAVVERFGPGVLTPDGSLDRPALGRTVFADEAARHDLEAIVHPWVRRRSDELVAAAGADAVVVHDIPLLVESDRAGDFDLVVVVGAPVATRVDRLVRLRGMSESAARQRIAAQADDARRRAVADVWIDNSGSVEQLRAEAVRVWHEVVLPRRGAAGDGRSPR